MDSWRHSCERHIRAGQQVSMLRRGRWCSDGVEVDDGHSGPVSQWIFILRGMFGKTKPQFDPATNIIISTSR